MTLAAPPARRFTVRRGGPHPLGATPDAEGTNFALFSRHATVGRAAPLRAPRLAAGRSRRSTLDPERQPDLLLLARLRRRASTPGMGYAYRVDGPKDLHGARPPVQPEQGADRPVRPRHDHRRCGTGSRPAARRTTSAHSLRSVVIDMTDYDWEGDQPLNRSMQDTIIYEMHVRGFTSRRPPASTNPGPISASSRRSRTCKRSGVTAVELLPVFEFDEDEISGTNPLTGQRLDQLLGLQPDRLLRPARAATASRPTRARQVREFRDMVKALHKAGIEVILDVVFNHTGEGNHEGPTLSFRGLDNSVYYSSSRTTSSSTRTLGLRQHGQLQPSRWSRSSSSSACGSGSARCTSTASASTWPRSCRAARTATPMDDPPVLWHIELDRRAGRHQDHRRGLGRRRACTRSAPSRATAGPSGTAATATTSAASSRATRAWSGRSPRGSPAAPTCTRPTASCRSTASTSSPPTTASRSTTSSPTTASTTRPTARATATATTTTSAGTTASKGRRDDPAIEALRDRQVQATSWRSLLLIQGVPMMRHGRRGPPDAVRQQQRLLPGQRDHLVRLDARRAARRPRPLHQRADRLPQGAPDAPPQRVLHRRGQRARAGRHLVARLPSVRPAGTTPSRGSSPSRSAGFPVRATGKSSRPTPTST